MKVDNKLNKQRIILILSLLFIFFPTAFFLTNSSFKLQSVYGKKGDEQLVFNESDGTPMGTNPTPTASRTPLPTDSLANTHSSKESYPPAIFAMRDGNFNHLFAFYPDSANLIRLSNDDWDDIYPEMSPDGTKLAYSSNRNGFWDLYIFDSANGSTIQITDTKEYDASPTWSPDGQWIAYESYIDGNLEIQIIATTPGSDPPIRLTKNAVADHSPKWAPQGRSILFVSNRTGEDEIWMADLENTDNRFENMSGQPTSLDRNPVWTPDGERIAWISTLDGVSRITILDSISQRKETLGIGSALVFSPDGHLVLAVIEYPNQFFITGYTADTHITSFVPKMLPGKIYGISWGQGAEKLSSALSLTNNQNSETIQLLENPLQDPDSQVESGKGLELLAGIIAPHPYLKADVVPSYFSLRQQIENEIGWNYLDYLENAFLPLTEPPPPGMPQSWLYTGRTIAVNPMPLYGGWMYVVREDYFGQTFWRVYLKARFQDGSQGEPIRSPVWNFSARYSGNTQSYELGGELNGIPEGYWVDFTEIALRYGWMRLPALNNWRTYFDGALFNQYVQSSDLDWRAAMETLYPSEALATATRFPTKTTTPTITPTYTRTPRPTATSIASQTSTPVHTNAVQP